MCTSQELCMLVVMRGDMEECPNFGELGRSSDDVTQIQRMHMVYSHTTPRWRL